MSWDDKILLFAASQRSAILDSFFRGVTWLGSLYVLTPMAVLLTASLLYVQRWREAGFLIVGFGGASLLVHLSKRLLDRPRPALNEPVIALPSDSSFPSAHTAQNTAFMICAALIIRAWWPEGGLGAWAVAIGSILAVGISRIYLQVHYPTDVLGGLALSLVWVALVKTLW